MQHAALPGASTGVLNNKNRKYAKAATTDPCVDYSLHPCARRQVPHRRTVCAENTNTRRAFFQGPFLNFRSGIGFVDFRPGIAQGNSAIEYKFAALAVFDKIAETFELIRGIGICLCERGLQFALIENLQ